MLLKTERLTIRHIVEDENAIVFDGGIFEIYI